MKLSDLYRQQRELERIIAQGKRGGWSVQEDTRKLNDLLAFRDAVTEIGSFSRVSFPEHSR